MLEMGLQSRTSWREGVTGQSNQKREARSGLGGIRGGSFRLKHTVCMNHAWRTMDRASLWPLDVGEVG